MNTLHWLMRAKRWAQNPPSEGRVKLVLGVVALCLVLVAVEYFIGWPDWMTVDSLRQKP
jgi:hypothetical protein